MPAIDPAEAARFNAIYDEARSADEQGDFEQAVSLIDLALDEPIGRTETRHFALLLWKAQILSAFGEPSSAWVAIRAACDVAVAATDGVRAAILGVEVARRAGDPEQGMAVFTRLAGVSTSALGSNDPVPSILDWLGSLGAPLLVEISVLLARLLADLGRYRTALAVLDRLRGGDLNAARDAIDVGQLHLLRCELLLSIGAIQRARSEVVSLVEPRNQDARLRHQLVRARIDYANGRLASAIERLRRWPGRSTGDQALFAAAATLRCVVETELNLLDAAQATAEHALRALHETSIARELIAMLEMAKQHALSKQHAGLALWELPFAPREARFDVIYPADTGTGDNRSRRAAQWTGHANEVMFALARADHPAAASSLEKLHDVSKGVESDYIVARVELVDVLVRFYSTTPPDCSPELEKLAAQFETLGAPLDQARALRFAAWAHARAGRYSEFAALAARTSSLIDQMASELGALDRAAFMLNKWSGRDELVSALVRELMVPAARRPNKRERRRAFLEIDQLTHWDIDQAFDLKDARAVDNGAVPDRALAWVRTQLSVPPRSNSGCLSLRSWLDHWRFPSKTVLLHYHMLPDRTFLFRIARGHIDVAALPVGRVHLQADSQGLIDSASSLADLAARLGICDAVRDFPGVKRLIIVPHDVLANVPFSALQVGGRNLCELASVIQVDRLEQLHRHQRDQRFRRPLAVGLSSYAGSELPDLPNTEPEAAAALDAVGVPGNSLLGARATVDAVIEQLRSADLVHIAAHGAFEARDPARSGIVLRSTSGGFSTLSLEKLRTLDLSHVGLVTLATCRSGASATFPGRARVCIPTALLDAGVTGVIASLWPLDDEVSVRIMQDLYSALSTQRPSVALASVQRSHKFAARDWAGLVFYGNG